MSSTCPSVSTPVAFLEQFAGENHLGVVGRNLGGVHLGSDLCWRRHRFDRRVTSGLFRLAGESFVTVSEIAACSSHRPSTAGRPRWCAQGAPSHLPPFGLPTHAGQPDLLPLWDGPGQRRRAGGRPSPGRDAVHRPRDNRRRRRTRTPPPGFRPRSALVCRLRGSQRADVPGV